MSPLAAAWGPSCAAPRPRLESYRLRPSSSARLSSAASAGAPSDARVSAIHSKSRRTSVPPASSRTASSGGRSPTGGSLARPREHQAPTLSPPGLGEEAPHRARVEKVLDLVDASLERRERVLVADVDHRLEQDRAVVELILDQVHRAPGHAHAVLPGTADCVEPGKRGEQRGMDIEDPVAEGVQQRLVEGGHEAREEHGLDSANAERLDPGVLVLEPGAIGPARRADGFDSEPSRALDRRRARLGAEKRGHPPGKLAPGRR